MYRYTIHKELEELFWVTKEEYKKEQEKESARERKQERKKNLVK